MSSRKGAGVLVVGAGGFQVDLPRRVFRRARHRRNLPAIELTRAELVARMRRFGLFAGLPQRVLAELAAAARVCVFGTGEHVWHRGETDRQAIFIEDGFVRAARINREGLSRTYGLFGPGDSMGLFAIWAGMKYPTDAIAMNDGVAVIVVDAAAIVHFAETHPRLSAPLRNEIGHFTEAFIQKIEIVSAGTVPQRLAVLMTQLIDRYGVDKKDQHARLPIALTLDQLSEIVGARMETVARALAAWKRAGWLRIDAGGCHFFHLDRVRSLIP